MKSIIFMLFFSFSASTINLYQFLVNSSFSNKPFCVNPFPWLMLNSNSLLTSTHRPSPRAVHKQSGSAGQHLMATLSALAFCAPSRTSLKASFLLIFLPSSASGHRESWPLSTYRPNFPSPKALNFIATQAFTRKLIAHDNVQNLRTESCQQAQSYFSYQTV